MCNLNIYYDIKIDSYYKADKTDLNTKILLFKNVWDQNLWLF